MEQTPLRSCKLPFRLLKAPLCLEAPSRTFVPEKMMFEFLEHMHVENIVVSLNLNVSPKMDPQAIPLCSRCPFLFSNRTHVSIVKDISSRSQALRQTYNYSFPA